MAEVYIDRVDNLQATERLGAVRSLSRKARVIFTNVDPPTDYKIMWLALEQAGVPKTLTTLSEAPTLVLVERSVELVDGDRRVADVTLKYEHFMDGPYQRLFSPPSGVIYGKMRSSITQLATNFFRPYGLMAYDPIQIVVAHSFRRDDPDPVRGQTIIQGGEINIPFPQKNFHFEGYVVSENPQAIVSNLLNTVNKLSWLNENPRTWLCSEVQFEVLDPVATPSYRFSFEFQNNPDSWDPTVVFNDQRTGRPPADIAAPIIKTVYPFVGDPAGPGVRSVLNRAWNPFQNRLPNTEQAAGYWKVPALREVDYNEYFGASFDGTMADR